jgi:hypothetical protein
MNSQTRFLDSLRRTFQSLRECADSEAQRRDLLIRPILVSPFGLGYGPDEVLGEIPYAWPAEFKQDFIFRGDKTPRRILPDYVLWPREWQKVAGVVEAKGPSTLVELSGHRFQLAEQQAAFSTNWGLLTNGSQWVVFHAFEPIIEVDSIDDLATKLPDICRLVGREAVLERMRRSGRASLVHLVVSDPSRWPFTVGPDEELDTLADRIRDEWLRERGLEPKVSKELERPLPRRERIRNRQMVEVVSGPLRGVVGRIVRRGRPGRLVLSVDLIGQAVSVEVDRKDVKRY